MQILAAGARTLSHIPDTGPTSFDYSLQNLSRPARDTYCRLTR